MTFSDTYLLGTNQANFPQVAAALDALLVGVSTVFTSGNINTTSTSFVDYTSASAAITIASGEQVLILAEAAFSLSGGSNNKASFQLTRDGAAIGKVAYGRGVSPGATDGVEQHVSFWHVETPSVGAHTYKIQWKTSSGTLYSADASLAILAFQTGA